MLRLADISVAYPNGVTALSATTVEFAKGRFTVLLGPSGAGKSTLLRSLNGLVRPQTGDITRAGMGSILASARAFRRHLLTTVMV